MQKDACSSMIIFILTLDVGIIENVPAATSFFYTRHCIVIATLTPKHKSNKYISNPTVGAKCRDLKLRKELVMSIRAADILGF